MPIEQSDNTRVELPQIILPIATPIPILEDLLWDADKTLRYRNLQTAYNTNFFGSGVFGNLTHIDPRTRQGLRAITSNIDYARLNINNFAGNIILPIALHGAESAIRWATTPQLIGSGAFSRVYAAPLSRTVYEVSSETPATMHTLKMLPNGINSRLIGRTPEGLYIYKLPRVRMVEGPKVDREVSKLMTGLNWKEFTHPNLLGKGYVKGNTVLTNIEWGRTPLGKLVMVDPEIETRNAFRIAMLKNGGSIPKFQWGSPLFSVSDLSPEDLSVYHTIQTGEPLPVYKEGVDVLKIIEPITDSIVYLFLSIFDPTGVSSYPDAAKAIEAFAKNPNGETSGKMLLEILGALPILGKVTKVPKVLDRAYKVLNKFPEKEILAMGNRYVDTFLEWIAKKGGLKQYPNVVAKVQNATSIPANAAVQAVYNRFGLRGAKHAVPLFNRTADILNAGNNISDVSFTIPYIKDGAFNNLPEVQSGVSPLR